MVLCLLAVAPLVLVDPPAPSGVVADVSSLTETDWIVGGWGTGSGPSFGSEPAAITMVDSPRDERSAMLSIGTDQSLRVSLGDGSSWGSPTLLSVDAGIDDSTTSDAAFEASSGRLLVAYRKGSSSLIYFRVYDAGGSPSWSSEDWFDLGLGAAPSRVLLRPRAGSNQMVLVGVSGTTARAAVWDGETFGDTTTLDSGFDNDVRAIDAEWSGNTAAAVWARSIDTTVRGATFDGDSWAASTSMPSVADPIRRVSLTPSNDRGTKALLMTLSTSDGADLALHAAVLASDAWTGASTLSTTLADEDRFAAAWETSGTAAVAVWAEPGETTLHAARWDGSAWSADTETADLLGQPERVVLRPASGIDDAAAALASVVIEEPRLEDYLVYASTGSADTGAATVNGLAGDNQGFTLPTPPTGTASGSNVSMSNNGSVTLSPGVYGNISTGNNCDLYVSAGDYVFGSMTSNKNSFAIHADTTGGAVRLIFASGNFETRNGLALSVVGPGPLEIHLLAGDFLADNNATVNASIIAHSGSVSFGTGGSYTAHIVASDDVTIADGTVSEPAWDSPFVDPSPAALPTTSLLGFTVSAGSPGSTTEIVAGWGESRALPFDLSWTRPTAGVRVTSWREVPSYNE